MRVQSYAIVRQPPRQSWTTSVLAMSRYPLSLSEAGHMLWQLLQLYMMIHDLAHF